jgi:hypothetical protein
MVMEHKNLTFEKISMQKLAKNPKTSGHGSKVPAVFLRVNFQNYSTAETATKWETDRRKEFKFV